MLTSIHAINSDNTTGLYIFDWVSNHTDSNERDSESVRL